MTSSGPEAPIRILLVDDHRAMRAGLRILLQSHPRFEVVGEAEDRGQALAQAESGHPDIVLLDLDLAGSSSLDFLPDLLRTAPSARVIILTGNREPEVHLRAVETGAMGILLKEKSVDVIFNAVEKVHAGEVWVDRSLMAKVLTNQKNRDEVPDEDALRISTLSQREREIVDLVGQGIKNEQIADRLFISEGTLRRHLATIFEKLELNSRLDLVFYAFRHGLAELPKKD